MSEPIEIRLRDTLEAVIAGKIALEATPGDIADAVMVVLENWTAEVPE
jgi:hypothetical protein